MPNVKIKIRKYSVQTTITLKLVMEEESNLLKKVTNRFRNYGPDRDGYAKIEVKENDEILNINNSYYLKREDFEYIQLDITNDFIWDNPKIFKFVM